MRAYFLSLVPVVAIVTACSAIVGIEEVPAPLAQPFTPVAAGIVAAVGDVATQYCLKFKACQPTAFDYSFRGIPECVSSITEGQTRLATLKGSSATVDSVKACAVAFKELTCSEFSGSSLALVCAAIGSRQNGETCLESTQCVSGFCADEAGNGASQCAVCLDAPSAGTPCKGGRCATGNTCSTDGNCIAVAPEGNTCGASQPCAPGLYCNQLQKCTKLPSAVGEACNINTGPICDLGSGLACLPDGPDAETGKCFAIVVSDTGSKCGRSDNPAELTAFVCRRGATCDQATAKCGPVPTEPGDPCPSGQCRYPQACVEGECLPLASFSVCE